MIISISYATNLITSLRDDAGQFVQDEGDSERDNDLDRTRRMKKKKKKIYSLRNLKKKR